MAKDYSEDLRIPGNHSAIIILGMGPQALFLARTYTKHYETVYLVGSKNWIGYLSRFGKKIISDESGRIKIVDKLISKHGFETPIIISGGSDLRYYLEESFMHSYNVYPKPLKHLNVLNDKSTLYNYVETKNYKINLLESWPFVVKTRDYDFPLILKWSRDHKEKPFKALIIQGKEELNELFNKYGQFSDYLILQKLVEKKKSLSFACFSLDGIIKKKVFVEQVRQYPPGLSNVVKPYNGEHIQSIAQFSIELIKNLNYTGYIEFEFIEDLEAKKIYLLECNPRPWGWIDYLKYDNDSTDNAAMVNITRDLYYLLKFEKRKFYGNLIRKAWKYLNYNKTIWSIDDPLPFIGQLLNIRK